MKPLLDNGDVVYVVYKTSFDIGDILVFYKGEELIIHRLIERRTNTLLCKGDNSFGFDYVKEPAVMGKAVFYVHNGHICMLPKANKEFISLAKAVNKLFFKHSKDAAKTIKSDVYMEYLRMRKHMCKGADTLNSK